MTARSIRRALERKQKKLARKAELEIPGVRPMMMRERRMHGWVRATPEVYGSDAPAFSNQALAFSFLKDW